MANKKERTHGGKEKKKKVGKKGNKQNKNNNNNKNSERKEEARNVSEQRVNGRIHVIRVHYWADNNTAGQKTLTNKDRMSGLVKHRDPPPPHPSLVHRKWTI